MEKTMYVSDLDGTLLHSGGGLSDFTRDRINGLMEKGLAFTYATARSLTSARRVTEGLRVTMPVVVQNGAFIMDPVTGERLYGCTMEPAALAPVLNLLEGEGIPALIYSILDGRERVSWLREHEGHSGIRNYLASPARQDDSRLRPVDSWRELSAGEIFYITVIEREREARRIYEQCLAAGDYCHVSLINDIYIKEEWWVELHRADVSKAAALERLRAMTGSDRLVCFGDNLNDIPMFRTADRSCAVENACRELREIATEVIASNDDDGVAGWLWDHAAFRDAPTEIKV